MKVLPGFDELFARADKRTEPVAIAAAGADDPTVIEALASARRRGWVRPILIGTKARIRSIASDLGVDLEGMELIHAEGDDVATRAVEFVRAGQANALMKGQIATPTLMKAVVSPTTGLRTGRIICQVVLMEIPRDSRRFLLADTGVTPRPDLAQKGGIAASAIAVARALGVPRPRLAIMAASESVNPSMPETVAADQLARSLNEDRSLACDAQGPLSFDLAYAEVAGARKKIGGPAVGGADAMIFNDLNSANMTVKAIMYTADCRFGGVLMGGTAPVVFMSRADTAATRLHSLALTLAILDHPPPSA